MADAEGCCCGALRGMQCRNLGLGAGRLRLRRGSARLKEGRRDAAYRVIARGSAGSKTSVQDAEDSESKPNSTVLEKGDGQKARKWNKNNVG